MAEHITGTFSTTGTSAEIASSAAVIVLDFDGTATVELQVRQSGTNWVAAETYTASTVYTFEPLVAVPFRLNCTAHTNNVNYAIYRR